MEMTITLGDLLSIILYIAGIVALISVTIFFSQLVKGLKKINGLIEENQENIDDIIVNLPEISENIKHLTYDSAELLNNIGPDVEDIVYKTKLVTDDIENTVSHVGDTVNFVSDSVADTALNLKQNVTTAQDYLIFVTEIVDIVKSFF